MNHINILSSIIPQPARFTQGLGCFKLSSSTEIQVDQKIYHEAQYLAERLRLATGFSLPMTRVTSDKSDANIIKLTLKSGATETCSEEYRLIVEPGTILIDAATTSAAFYGVQTLLQLLPPAVFSHGPRDKIDWLIPCVIIEDYPRFSWRGCMLDSSRYFQPISFIKKFIDLLALHKINKFHWHLTDDQGWRIEIKKYPKLTEVGAWRHGTMRGHLDLNFVEDDIPHGGFYSQAEARDIVKYADARHIMIIPEIEMPGHAQAAIAAYHDLGCSRQMLRPCSRWGVNENIFNPSEKTIEFLQNVLEEVLDIFPSPFIHIGGDEAIKKQWDASSEVQSYMAKYGVIDSAALQSYFIKKMDQFLDKRGRRLIGWDEILDGGLAPGATVMSWRGIEGGVIAANAGHDVIMAPAEFTYFDSYQSSDIEDEPLAIGGHVSLEKVYYFEPISSGIATAKITHVLGVQGQLWTEYMPTTNHVEYMAFPRLCALAEVGWSSKVDKDYVGFKQRLRKHLKRLDLLDVKYHAMD